MVKSHAQNQRLPAKLCCSIFILSILGVYARSSKRKTAPGEAAERRFLPRERSVSACRLSRRLLAALYQEADETGTEQEQGCGLGSRSDEFLSVRVRCGRENLHILRHPSGADRRDGFANQCRRAAGAKQAIGVGGAGEGP